jgi:hypothetical protein
MTDKMGVKEPFMKASPAGGKGRAFTWLQRHRVWCFVLMTLSFVTFGALTLDLARLVEANLSFLLHHGSDALAEGGLRQLLEIWAGAVVAIAAYLLFKVCEAALVQSFMPDRKG